MILKRIIIFNASFTLYFSYEDSKYLLELTKIYFINQLYHKILCLSPKQPNFFKKIYEGLDNKRKF